MGQKQNKTKNTKKMSTFNVPTRSEVSENNQVIFDNLQKALGFVPNLYATYAHSETALQNFEFLERQNIAFSQRKRGGELAVSQVNECIYCLSAHTAIGKMNGFTEDQILEIRSGRATFNTKLDALARLAKNITENRGRTN